MAILVNHLNCDQNQLGTGILECMANIDSEPIGFFLVDRNWTADVADPNVFDQQYLTDRIQDRTFIPFLNKTNFTDNSEETVLETFDSGIKGRVRSGYPEFAFEYDNGLYFHKAAYSHNSFQQFNVVIAFANNALLLARSEDLARILGFQGGYVDTATYKLKTGSTVNKTMMAFQLTNPNQFNLRAVPLYSQQTQIELSQVNGIIDVLLTLETPAAAATDLVFTARAAANQNIDIQGLSDTDFRVLGTTGNIVSVTFDDATRQYTMVLDAAVAAAEEIYIQLWDAAFIDQNGVNTPVPAVDVGEEIYSGTSNTVTVV